MHEKYIPPSGWMLVVFTNHHGFIAAYVIEADTEQEALLAAYLDGWHPGGAAHCSAIPYNLLPAPEYRDRLLTQQECHNIHGWEITYQGHEKKVVS